MPIGLTSCLRHGQQVGRVTRGIAGYGDGLAYAASILRAEAVLAMHPADPIPVIEPILHPRRQ